MNIVLNRGERGLIVGQTGSGKTAFAAWLLENFLPAPGIIYDTKIEPKFSSLSDSIIVEKHSDILKAYSDKKRDLRYVTWRPPIGVTSDPELLDAALLWQYEKFRGSLAYIDEAYQFHINGRAGPGLVSLLTRGRSRGITTLLSTQRPAWLSRFCLTESQRFYVFRLVDAQDQKRLADVIPGFSELPNPPKFSSYYFDFDLEKPLLLKPIALDTAIDTGYIDTQEPDRQWL